MVKQQPENSTLFEDQTPPQAPSLTQNHITNPMLLSDNAIQIFPIHQEMEIDMKEQYITFINEDNIKETVDRKNAFITALLCLQNVLLPEEDVEEIEISIVSEKETKIHALLLNINHNIFAEESLSEKVSFMCF